MKNNEFENRIIGKGKSVEELFDENLGMINGGTKEYEEYGKDPTEISPDTVVPEEQMSFGGKPEFRYDPFV